MKRNVADTVAFRLAPEILKRGGWRLEVAESAPRSVKLRNRGPAMADMPAANVCGARFTWSPHSRTARHVARRRQRSKPAPPISKSADPSSVSVAGSGTKVIGSLSA